MKLKSFSIALSGMFLFFCYTCSSSHGWKQISSVGTLSNNEIGSIVFFNVFEGIAISPNELIQTNDGGETWKVVFHNKGASYKKIVKTSAESALVIGSDVRDVFDIEDGNEPSGSQKRQPTILKTDNRGADWDKVTIEPELLKKREDRFPSFTDLCVDKNGVVWIVGDNGIIQAKLDNDNLKIDSVTAKDEAFVAINCRNSGDIIAVGVFGVLLNHRHSLVSTTITSPVAQGHFYRRFGGDCLEAIGSTYQVVIDRVLLHRTARPLDSMSLR